MKCKICNAPLPDAEHDLCEKHRDALLKYENELRYHAVPSLYYELVNRWIHRQKERARPS